MHRSIIASTAAALALAVAGCSSTDEQSAPEAPTSPSVSAASPAATPKPDMLDAFPLQHMTLTKAGDSYNVTLDDGSPIPALVFRRTVPGDGSPLKIDPKRSCGTVKGGKLLCWESAKAVHERGHSSSVVVSLTHDGTTCSFTASVDPGDRLLRSCNRPA